MFPLVHQYERIVLSSPLYKDFVGLFHAQGFRCTEKGFLARDLALLEQGNRMDSGHRGGAVSERSDKQYQPQRVEQGDASHGASYVRGWS